MSGINTQYVMSTAPEAESGFMASALGVLACGCLLVAILFPGLPTTLVFCFLAAVFSFYRVDIFLFAAVLLLPLSPVMNTGLRLHNISSLLQLSMFVGFACYQFALGVSLQSWILRKGINRLAVAFVLVVLACTLVFHRPTTSSMRACSELVAGLCFFLTLGEWVQSESQVKRILHFILASGIAVSLFGFYQALIDDYGDLYFWLYPKQAEILEPWTGRITSVLNYSNSLAGYINLVTPIAVGLLLIPIGARSKILAAVSLAVCAAALLLTASRGGLGSFLTILLIAAIYLTQQAKTRKWLLIVSLVTLAIGMILVFGVIRTPWAEEDPSTAMRFLFWGVAGVLFISSPILGIGYGNFRDLYDLPGIASGVFDVHNLYLQLLAETGVVGFVAFGAMIAFIIRQCIRALRRPKRDLSTIVNFAALGGVIALLFHGFVDFLFIVSPQFTSLFWLILALVVVTERWQQNISSIKTTEIANGSGL